MAKEKQPAWQSRIVGYGELPASEFQANFSNWRIHPKAQQDALRGILDQVGWVQNVIVNKRTDASWGRDQGIETLVDGHARIVLALRQGDDTPVPVTYVDINPQDEALILAALDPISALAGADREKLDALLRDVQTGDAAVQAMLAELAKDAGLDYGKAEDADAEPQIDRAEELRVKWGVESGMMFGIGKITRCPKCGKVHDL